MAEGDSILRTRSLQQRKSSNQPRKKTKRRYLAAGSIIVLVLAAAFAAAFWPRGHKTPPNVVIIVLDTVRDDCVGAGWHGVPLTPSVDAIAAEGTRFTNAFAAAPWTVPSHASLFTGLHAHRHNAVHERFVLAASFTTLAERLKAHGYATAGVTCNPWLTHSLGFNQGFDNYFEVYADSKPDEHDSPKASTQAIEWLRQRSGDKRPFLLFINYLDAHLPYTPAAEVLKRLEPDPAAVPRSAFSIAQSERFIGGLDRLSPADLQEVRRVYSAEILAQDAQVARVLDYLRRSGELDKTLLIITADHGEQLGEHGFMGHEFSLYEQVLHVPLIVRYPGVFPAGHSTPTAASLIDVLPTIIDIVGLDPPAEPLPGHSLRLLLAAPPAADRPLLGEYARPATLIGKYWRSSQPRINMSAYDTSLKSLRLGRLKYIAAGSRWERLYDLSADPGEQRDLSAEKPEELARMRARLAEEEKGP
jgi:arylsulfatase A-like enzyme